MMKTLKSWMLLLTIVLSIVSCSDNYDTPVVYAQLDQVLAETGLFSDIKENPDAETVSMKADGELNYLSQYSMFITQPVNHDQPDGDTFKQKVCILFRGYDRPTILVTEGYNFRCFGDAKDVGTNLNANMVHVEHRNYGESYNQDDGQWKYQTCAQASADLHAVYQALKPIFKGRWMSAGSSKSGETSMDYAYYYPNDMCLAAAFCSPFFVSLDDKCYGEYLFNEAGTEELREMMKKNIRWALTDGENGLYKSVCQKYKENGFPEPTYSEYVCGAIWAFASVFTYYLSNQQQKVFEEMTKDEESFVSAIYDAIRSGMSDKYYNTYLVESAKEQGFENFGYDYFADLLEGTSFKAENVLKDKLKEKDRFVLKQYDNSLRIDMRENFFVNSTVPLLFYYSHNDSWTGGQPDKLGPNAKKIINPIGVHTPIINNPIACPPEIKQEVMDFISTYIY